MKQPPRPRRSRFSSAPEASSESSQDFVAPEEATGEGSSSDTVPSSPEASISDRPALSLAQASISDRPALSLAQASSDEEKKETERAARRKRNRELRRARREASAQSPSSGELLNRPLGQSDAAAILGSSDESATADLNERRRERTHAHRRLLLTRLASACGAVIVVCALVWGVFFSPLFALDMSQVSIEGLGEDTTTQNEVRAAIEPFASVPLPRLKTSAIDEQIAKVRLVREAHVQRSWPRGLSVQVRPRQAILAVKEGTSWALVDDQGVTVSSASTAPEGMAPTTLPDGDQRAQAAADVAAIWTAMGDDLRSKIAMITHDGQTVSMTLTNSRTLNWGVAKDNELKAKVAAVLISQRQARTYDVSSPVHPVTS